MTRPPRHHRNQPGPQPAQGDVTSLLFVCLGNICRSPLAEAIFLHLAEQRAASDRFQVDSCGLGSWHVGERPDPRAAEVARRHGVRLDSVARQLAPARDFQRFDMLLAMDRANLRGLLDAGAPPRKVHLLRSFDPAVREAMPEVPDPYYGGNDGFETVYRMLHAACNGLLDHLLRPRRD